MSDKKPKASRASAQDIRFFITEHMKTRYNSITMKTECRWLQPSGEDLVDKSWMEWHEMSDREVNTLWRKLEERGVRARVQDFYSVINSDMTQSFNPIFEFIMSLESNGDDTDYIRMLADHVHVKPAEGQSHEAAQQEFYEYFRKWFVALLPSALLPDTVNNVVLTLIGPQGCYKSSFFHYLLPQSLRRYFWNKGDAAHFDKDDRLRMTSHWLICLDEISAMTPRETSELNAAITMKLVNERAPYARCTEQRPHIASFCATGNNLRFLTDRTGSRRWLPFEVESIDDPSTFDYHHQQLYSQARDLWMSHFRYWFDAAEVERLRKRNRRFEVPNQELELIDLCYQLPKEGDDGILVSTADIMDRIKVYGHMGKDPSSVRIGQAMKELGFLSVHTRLGMKYYVLERNVTDMELKRQREGREFMSEQPF